MRATRQAFHEAGRNALAAPFLYGALLVTVALLTAAAVFADLHAVARIVSAERAFLDAGGDILRAAHSDGRVDASACVAIGDIEGVTAASAVTSHQVRLAGRPEHPQTVMAATPGFEDVVGAPALQPGQILTSARVLDRWSWQAGTQVQLLPAAQGPASELWEPPAGLLSIAGTADLSRLGDGAESALIVPAAATGTADECIVRAEPAALDTVIAVLPALLGETEPADITVQRQVPVGEFGPDPATDFAGRPTRYASLAAGATSGLLLAFITWTRRQRSALYATLGMPRSAGVVLRALEATIPIVIGTTWGTLWVTLAAHTLPLPTSTILRTATAHGLATTTTALALITLTSLWRPPTLQALKDR